MKKAINWHASKHDRPSRNGHKMYFAISDESLGIREMIKKNFGCNNRFAIELVLNQYAIEQNFKSRDISAAVRKYKQEQKKYR